MFETNRLILRPFQENDINFMLDLWNEPEVQRGTTADYLVPRSKKFKEKLREWVRSLCSCRICMIFLILKDTICASGR